ncbi:MAG: tyrosine--tRNA ligase [Candidatus Aerophobetes bacterium]|nr:tyrosine--tRNA ligase [Candidatus Aerophobetes bacterium]
MNSEEQVRLIKKNTVDLVQEEELLRRIKRKGSLIIKFGVDPTSPDIHLGHSLVLLKLRCFQNLGHKVVLLIGDFTAKVGDPSGRDKTRKTLSTGEIRANARTYKEQAFKILNSQKTEVLYNSAWLSKMSFSRVLKLASHYTVARMLERDDFNERYRKRYPVGLHEFLYPLMQAYDSVALKADVEIGGTDQKFNLLLGRQVQKSYGQAPQVIITLPILEGTDGAEKMSKSLGNYIGITESPPQMYGKLMSIPDNLVFRYFRLLTLLSEEEIRKKEKAFSKGRVHPKQVKKDLASQIVAFYYGESSAKEEEKRFEDVFKKGKVPEKLPSYYVHSCELKGGKIWIIKLLKLAQLAGSGSEARRLIAQGGVRWDGRKIENVDLELSLDNEHILQVGKRRFMKIIRL